MQAQHFLRGDVGRYWVALSLREAETLRALIHASEVIRLRLGLRLGLRFVLGLGLGLGSGSGLQP